MKRLHIVFVIVATLATLSFVTVRLDIVKSSYKIHELEVKQKALQDEIGTLNAKINSDRSPEKLERIARRNLSMQPPDPGQIYVLRVKK
jgi:cell division protein FtsL